MSAARARVGARRTRESGPTSARSSGPQDGVREAQVESLDDQQLQSVRASRAFLCTQQKVPKSHPVTRARVTRAQVCAEHLPRRRVPLGLGGRAVCDGRQRVPLRQRQRRLEGAPAAARAHAAAGCVCLCVCVCVCVLCVCVCVVCRGDLRGIAARSPEERCSTHSAPRHGCGCAGDRVEDVHAPVLVARQVQPREGSAAPRPVAYCY